MRFIRQFAICILTLSLIGFFVSCEEDGGGNGTGSGGQPPIIESLTAQLGTNAVDLGQTTMITVTAADPEGDTLTYIWDASAGYIDTVTAAPISGDKSGNQREIKYLETSQNVVYWTAPQVADPSVVIVWACDESNETYESLEFSYDAFSALQSAPVIQAVSCTPGHTFTHDGVDEWWLNIVCMVQDGQAGEGVSRITAQIQGGQYYNLVFDSQVNSDFRYLANPGPSVVIQMDEINNQNEVKFNAYNNYYTKSDTSYFIHFLPDSILLVYDPDAGAGELSGGVNLYYNTAPVFKWRPYPDDVGISYDDILKYEMTVRRLSDMALIWQVDSVEYTAVSADTFQAQYNYNLDFSSPLELELYEEYILVLTVIMENAWATREREFGITLP
ncbi:hypothetical protein ISS30_03250 [bacterium]|nr:hypothetical protein [FCB group bacterium]MBL7190688.1 hypothetical protein [bacterium]